MNKNYQKKYDINYANSKTNNMKPIRINSKKIKKAKEIESEEIINCDTHVESKHGTFNNLSFIKEGNVHGNYNIYSRNYANQNEQTMEVLYDENYNYNGNDFDALKRGMVRYVNTREKCIDKGEEMDVNWEECVISQMVNDECFDVDKINNITFGNDEDINRDFVYVNSSFIENEKKLFRMKNLNQNDRNIRNTSFEINESFEHSRFNEKKGTVMQSGNCEARVCENDMYYYKTDIIRNTENDKMGNFIPMANDELMYRNKATYLYEKSNSRGNTKEEFNETRPPQFQFLRDEHLTNNNHNFHSPYGKINLIHRLNHSNKWKNDQIIQNGDKICLEKENIGGEENNNDEKCDGIFNYWPEAINESSNKPLMNNDINAVPNYEIKNNVNFIREGLNANADSPLYVSPEESRKISYVLENNDEQNHVTYANNYNKLAEMMQQPFSDDKMLLPDGRVANSFEKNYNAQHQQFIHGQQEINNMNNFQHIIHFNRFPNMEHVPTHPTRNHHNLNPMNDTHNINKLQNFYDKNINNIQEENPLTRHIMENNASNEVNLSNVHICNIPPQNKMNYYMTLAENAEISQKELPEMGIEKRFEERYHSSNESYNKNRITDMFPFSDRRNNFTDFQKMNGHEQKAITLELMKKKMISRHDSKEDFFLKNNAMDNSDVQMRKHSYFFVDNTDFNKIDEKEAIYLNRINNAREESASLRNNRNCSYESYRPKEYHQVRNSYEQCIEKERKGVAVKESTYPAFLEGPHVPDYEINPKYASGTCRSSIEEQEHRDGREKTMKLHMDRMRSSRVKGRHINRLGERHVNSTPRDNYGNTKKVENSFVEYVTERETHKDIASRNNDRTVKTMNLPYSAHCLSQEKSISCEEKVVDNVKEITVNCENDRNDRNSGERETDEEDDFVEQLKMSNMFKLTNFLKTHFKNMEVDGLNDDMYNYYMFINKISANLKRHNYVYKYKGIMQKSDKDKLLRIKLSCMIVNPSIQKYSGKWNFKVGERDKGANAKNREEYKTHLDACEEQNNDANVGKACMGFDKMGNSFSGSGIKNKEIRKDEFKGTMDEVGLSPANSYSMGKIQNIYENIDSNEDAVFIANLKHYNSFLKEYFDSTLNKAGEQVYVHGNSYRKCSLEENVFNTDVNKLLSFSLTEEDLYNNSGSLCERTEQFLENGSTNFDIEREEGVRGKRDILNDTEEDTKLPNYGMKLFCKYENIKKLGKHVFATIHEPRNLIELGDNKELEDVNNLVEKILRIMKISMEKINASNLLSVTNDGNDLIDDEKNGKKKNERKERGKQSSREIKEKENDDSTYAKINNENVLLSIDERMINNTTKKIVEYLWDSYIDIKNIFKDIDKCPYTHIETIAKYKEEVQNRKNILLNFIFLHKNDSERIVSYDLFDKSNNLFSNRNVSAIDVMFNKEMYIYSANMLQNYFSIFLQLKRPTILEIMKRLRYENAEENKNKNAEEMTEGKKEISVEKKRNQEKKEQEENYTQYYTNSMNVKGNHFNNIFIYNFPYANNLCQLHKFGFFGYTLPFNEKYNFFNFDLYNECNIYLEHKKGTTNDNGKWNYNWNNSYKKSNIDKKNEHADKKSLASNKKKGGTTKKFSSIVHKEMEQMEVQANEYTEELNKLKNSCFLFVNCFLKNKGTVIYKKILKIMKKNKRKVLIYLLFKNYYLIFHILSHADICFEEDIEYEDFLRVQLIYVNANVNSLNKLLKDEKRDNEKAIGNAADNNKKPFLNIRHKLYNSNIYASLYIYLLDITLSYLFTPEIGVSFIQNILCLLLFYNHIYLYITKIIQYTSGAAFLTILIVKIIPYLKSFDKNVVICFLYSVLHSLFYILSNIYFHHLESNKKHFQGNTKELGSHILTFMEHEIEFYKIIFKSICSYMNHDACFKEDITQMLQEFGKDKVGSVLLNELQNG